jgi:hypothetical protein
MCRWLCRRNRRPAKPAGEDERALSLCSSPRCLLNQNGLDRSRSTSPAVPVIWLFCHHLSEARADHANPRARRDEAHNRRRLDDVRFEPRPPQPRASPSRLFVRSLSIRRSAASTRSRARSRSAWRVLTQQRPRAPWGVSGKQYGPPPIFGTPSTDSATACMPPKDFGIGRGERDSQRNGMSLSGV